MKLLTPEESMYTCVRCGACREVCPTLDITGREADGPRGRVFMARSLLEGAIPVDEEIEKQLDRCLLCSACVDVCPVDVQVPEIVMLAKSKIAAQKSRPFGGTVIRKLFFKHLFPYQNRLQFIGHLLWFYQKSGFRKLLRKLGMMRIFPEQLGRMESVMPEILPPWKRKVLPAFTASVKSSRGDKLGQSDPEKPSAKEESAKAALFRGCVMDVMFRGTNENSIKLLSKSGFDTIVPVDQVCCGALHTHAGEEETAKELAKRNIEAFEQTGADYIISNAGGCGASLREYEEWFRNDPEWLPRARSFSSKIRDISEIVANEGQLPEAVGGEERVTYQPSCHLQYIMGVKEAPRKLLKSIPDTHFVDLPEAGLCCGSAGIYNLLQPEMSNDIIDKKMTNVKATKSNIVVTANPGCLLQMQAGIKRAGLQDQIKAVHIVDHLIKSIERAENQE